MDALELKKYLLERGTLLFFDHIISLMNPKSAHFDYFIQQKLRLNSILNDFTGGYRKLEEKENIQNQINGAILEKINELESNDFISSNNKGQDVVGQQEKSVNDFWSKLHIGWTTFIVCNNDYGINGGNMSTLVELNHLRATCRLISKVSYLGVKNYDIIPCASLPGDRFKDNMIIIGNPFENVIAKRVFERLTFRLNFRSSSTREICVHDSYRGITKKIEKDRNDYVHKDYGLLLKIHSPFGEDKNCILVAGCTTYGALAAAELLLNERRVSELSKELGNGSFEVLVETEILNNWPQSPRIITAYEISK